MELVFLRKDGGFLREWDGKDVHTRDGIIPATEIKPGEIARSAKGTEYLVLKPSLRDRIQYMKKGARPIYEYDAGLITALLGINRESAVLEAGTGSGCMTLILANQAKTVETFEKEERFYTIAKENIEKAGIKNVKMHNSDLLDAKLGNYDAVFLDMHDPTKAMEKTAPHLKRGRFMAVFTPIIDDLKPIAQKFECLGFAETQIIQLDLKKLEIKKYLRVKGLFGFPGFVVVARRFS